MAKRMNYNIFILVIFGLYVAYYRLFLSYSQNSIADYINIATILIFTFIAILLLGYRKDKLNQTKKSIIGITITEVLIFLAISYGLGVVTGYIHNTYYFDINLILKNIIAPIIYILAIEVFRYTILSANSDKKSIFYIVTILITILELSMGFKTILLYNFETIFKAVSSIAIPIIIKNFTMSYLAIHGGLKPLLIYRLIMDTYMNILPIAPDLGEYLTSVIGILLPTLVYMYSARTLDIKLEESQPVKESKTFRFGDIPMVLFIIVLVGLISGKFTYSIIGIGSESMTPTIDKGDAVIYKSITDESDLNVGDIIVFKNGSKIIIHRLIEIKEDENKNYYITKGDANNSKDNINLTIEDIKGKVLFKIKYLAYPNLWLKEIVNKE